MTTTTKKVLTEDLGKMLEMAICLNYDSPYDGTYKYSLAEAQSLKNRLSNLKKVFNYNLRHCASRGSKYDFECVDDPSIHLSAKTSKNKTGKVCPQVLGQPSRKKFCEFFALDQSIGLDQIKSFISNNIANLLQVYSAHTFDCPILYYNKHSDLLAFIVLKEEINWAASNINFSHNISGIEKIIKIIRDCEKANTKHIAIVADLQGIKLRIGKIFGNQVSLKKGDTFNFDLNKKIGSQTRVYLPYPEIFKKIKKSNKILIDDGKFVFKIAKLAKNSIQTVCQNDCVIKNFKSIHIPGLEVDFDNLTAKDNRDVQIAKKLNCNWIALSYVKNSKIIKETRKLISKDIGIIAKIENKSAIKNIKDIINASDAIMVARGDLAVEIGANEVPHVQLDIVKKCSELGKPIIIATQMLESMIENNKPTRAEINDVGTAVFQGADVVMLSAETAVGKYPLQTVQAMKKTIVSTEKYKKENIAAFKSNIKINNEPVKAIALAIKDIAYNIKVEAIIGFSVTGNTAKLISAIRPSAKIITISPHINISRQLSLLWGITSITNSDAKNWTQMMEISKKIIKSRKLTKIGGYAIITAGLPFGKSKMTNMIRLYQLGKN
jgi:pyruvate kinase